MDSRNVVEEAPALHGLTPEFVFQAGFVQRGPCTLQDVSVLALYHAIGGRTVVRAGVVPPLEAGSCLRKLSRVVGVEELRIAGACEVS